MRASFVSLSLVFIAVIAASFILVFIERNPYTRAVSLLINTLNIPFFVVLMVAAFNSDGFRKILYLFLIPPITLIFTFHYFSKLDYLSSTWLSILGISVLLFMLFSMTGDLWRNMRSLRILFFAGICIHVVFLTIFLSVGLYWLTRE